jgi:hypothetical protein
MARLSLAEHCADQPIEKIDRLIREAGAQIERDRDKRGLASLALIACDMLRRCASSFAGELSQARLVHTMTMRLIEADLAKVFQPFDQAEHCRRLGRLGHLPQPGEPRLTGFLPTVRKCIEVTTLVGREPIRKAPPDLTARLISDIDAQAFQRSGWRQDNPALPAGLHNQLRQMNQPVIFDCMRKKPTRQLSGRHPSVGAEPKSLLKLRRMAPPILVEAQILVQGFGQDINLLSHERHQGGWRALAGSNWPPGVAQVTEHQGKPEPVVVAAAAPDGS